MTKFLEEKLQKRRQAGNLRELYLVPKLIDFASNDYLGLANSLELAERVDREIAQNLNLYGIGSTGSRLLTGNSLYAQQLEEQIAAFHGFSDGVIFNCGYMANLGLLSSIMSEKDAVIFDAGVHASIRDGIRLSKAKVFPFKHNDISHLERRLQRSLDLGNRFICVESIYSTDGSLAPLVEICQLAKQFDAQVIVDEAHAVGVCGPYGAGVVMEKKLTSEIFAQVIVFSKALGVQGAIVLGNKTLKKALINFSHAYIYTSALPFSSLAAIKCSYELFPSMKKERADLKWLVDMFKEKYPEATGSHIQPIPISGNENAKRMAEYLKLQGFDVRALLSPTVQRGHEILRINLHAYNHENQLKALIKHLINKREIKDE